MEKNIDNISRKIRKRELVFKKLRAQKSRELAEFLEHIICSKNYIYTAADVVSSILLDANRVCSTGLRVSKENRKIYSIDLKGESCKLLQCFSMISGEVQNEWVFIIPDNWQYCGGFAVSLGYFFSHFDSFSYFMEDGFIAYGVENFESYFKFLGERTDNKISSCEMIFKGTIFLAMLEDFPQEIVKEY